MLKNNRDKKICAKYGSQDENGRYHCYECPLHVGSGGPYDFRCKANSHYDRRTKEWEYDDAEVNQCTTDR